MAEGLTNSNSGKPEKDYRFELPTDFKKTIVENDEEFKDIFTDAKMSMVQLVQQAQSPDDNISEKFFMDLQQSMIDEGEYNYFEKYLQKYGITLSDEMKDSETSKGLIIQYNAWVDEIKKVRTKKEYLEFIKKFNIGKKKENE